MMLLPKQHLQFILFAKFYFFLLLHILTNAKLFKFADNTAKHLYPDLIPLTLLQVSNFQALQVQNFL